MSVTLLKRWSSDDKAAIAVEVGILMPVMLILMMGVVDTGMSVLINQKTINASQTVGDLLGREIQVNDTIINNTIEAGRLALMPYSTTHYGVDIAGIQFDGGPEQPKVMWRKTVNMTANASILTGAQGLGKNQDGVLGVTVQYKYTPLFSGAITGERTLYEVSYVRGRKGLFIPKV